MKDKARNPSMTESSGDVSGEMTQLLVAWGKGNEHALDQLMPLVETEMRRLALRFMARERKGHSLQATALMNEAYLRLANWEGSDWQSRSHFFAVAAKVMRRILVDHARHRKHSRQAVELVTNDEPRTTPASVDVIALDSSLSKLAAFDGQKAQVVELRFFGGMTEEETAEALGLPLRTVQREWSLARAWLFCDLTGHKARTASTQA